MKLIFVYNADQGVFNAITDTIHKVLSPSTYECQLCQFTYGMTTMHKKWRDYLVNLDVETVFLHRDEFLKKYPAIKVELPAIFVDDAGQMRPFLTAEEINACSNLDALIEAVDKQISTLESSI